MRQPEKLAQRPLSRASIALLGCVLLFATSCSFVKKTDQIPKTQQEAGSTHVAVLSVAPWEEYASALQPTFGLTEAQALALAAANTQASEEKLIEALALTLKLAPPTSTTSESKTLREGVLGEDGKPLPERERTRTDAEGPGDVAGVEIPSAAGLPLDGSIPDAKRPLASDLALEPMLKYAAATALFQEVKMLDRYIKDAVMRRGFKPFVVRLQVSVLPAARRMPIDAYSTVSFFSGNGDSPSFSSVTAGVRGDALLISANLRALGEPQIPCGQVAGSLGDAQAISQLQKVMNAEEAKTFAQKVRDLRQLYDGDRPSPRSRELCQEVKSEIAAIEVPADGPTEQAPFVVPLLVTDDLERSISSRSVSQARQMALGLKMLSQGFGGAFGFDRLSQKLDTVLGSDYNSLLTVGRVTDNSFRVRLGAMQQVGTQYAMVPRTHNLTLLLLVPDSIATGHPKTTGWVSILAQTSFRNANDGKLIAQLEGSRPEELCKAILTPLAGSTHISCDAAMSQGIWDAVLNNNWTQFRTKVPHGLPLENVWVHYVEKIATGSIASTNFQVPARDKGQLFCSQSGLVRDDGKSAAKIALTGGRKLSKQDVRATLLVACPCPDPAAKTPATCKPGWVEVPSSESTVSADGASATFTFPSINKLGLRYQPTSLLRLDCPQCETFDSTRCQLPAIPPIALPVWNCPSGSDLIPGGGGVATAAVYGLVVPPAAAEGDEDPAARFKIAIGSGAVVADAAGKGVLTLKLTKAKEFASFAVAIAVAGADVKKTIAIPAAGEDLLDQLIIRANGQFTTVRIELENLVPLQTLQVSANEIVEEGTPKTWVAKAAAPKREVLVVPADAAPPADPPQP